MVPAQWSLACPMDEIPNFIPHCRTPGYKYFLVLPDFAHSRSVSVIISSDFILVVIMLCYSAFTGPGVDDVRSDDEDDGEDEDSKDE